MCIFAHLYLARLVYLQERRTKSCMRTQGEWFSSAKKKKRENTQKHFIMVSCETGRIFLILSFVNIVTKLQPFEKAHFGACYWLTLNESHILYHVDLMTTPPYILFPSPCNHSRYNFYSTTRVLYCFYIWLRILVILTKTLLCRSIVDQQSGVRRPRVLIILTTTQFTREHNKTHAENFWSTFTCLPLSHMWHMIPLCRCTPSENVQKTERLIEDISRRESECSRTGYKTH